MKIPMNIGWKTYLMIYLNSSTTNKMKKLVTMRNAPKNSCQILWKIVSNLQIRRGNRLNVLHNVYLICLADSYQVHDSFAAYDIKMMDVKLYEVCIKFLYILLTHIWSSNSLPLITVVYLNYHQFFYFKILSYFFLQNMWLSYPINIYCNFSFLP